MPHQFGQVMDMFKKKMGTHTVAAVPSATPMEAPRHTGAATGAFMVPSSGRYSSAFGPRTHPVTGVQRSHRGIDIAAPFGTPIYAADGGVVLRSDTTVRGYGTLIEIDHGNGFKTRYGHSRKLFVTKGDRVTHRASWQSKTLRTMCAHVNQ